jgi:uncharacterized protein (TIRG00374 family)
LIATNVRRIRAGTRRLGSRFWIALFVVLAAAFLLRQRSDIGRSLDALAGADAGWLAVCAGVQVATLALIGLTYQVALGRVRHDLTWRRGVDLHLERHVVGTLTPLGGPASVYVYLRRLSALGVGSSDALLALGIRSVAGYAAFVALLIPALLLHRPAGFILAGFAILSVLLVTLLAGFAVLLRGWRLPPRVARRLPAAVHAFITQARAHRLTLRALGVPFGLALAANLASALLLYGGLLAMGQHPPLATAVVGYAIGNLFLLVAPVFQGAGVVELTMAVALQQLGIPAPAAIGATLLFRLGDVWLPLAMGLLLQAGRRLPQHRCPLPAGQQVTAALGGRVALRPAALGLGMLLTGASAIVLRPSLPLLVVERSAALAVVLLQALPAQLG